MASSVSLEMEIKLAAQEFLSKLGQLESRFNATMNAVEGDASSTATTLDGAFRVLGIKGVQAVEAEVKQLQAALAQIRNSPDVLPADKAAAVAAFNARLAELRTEAQGTPPAIRAIAPAADSAGSSLASAAHKAVAWTAALAGINSVTDLVGNLVATGSEFENLRGRLENLLGGTEKAAAAFDMIKRLAATTPFEVTALTESFVKLTAFGMQPTEEQMRALSDVAANLGGGTEVLTGVTLALGQAWTKGKLQGEEIMQLAERGVPVWDALARATGRTVPELQAMSEAGTLGRDVISSLITELGRMNAGASDKLMNTYAGAVSNAKDALAEFFDMVSRSGLLEFLTQKVQELLAEFDRMKQSGELEAAAKAISDTFVQMASAIEIVVKTLAQFGPQIKLVAEAAVALKVANLAGTLLGIASASGAAASGMAAMGAASATSASQLEVAAVAGGRMAAMLRLLRSLSGIGLVMGVAELAQEFFRAKSAAEQGDAAVRKMLETPPASNKPKEAAGDVASALDTAAARAGDLQAEFDRLIEKGGQADEALGAIGKKFDLSNAPGIKTAAQVLDGLVTQGKISAAQFNDAWASALKGENLLAFEARAKQALGGVQGSGEQLAQALDAGLREAIRRAGGDFDQISGGMGKAAQSAVNDVEFLVGNLDILKAKGVDVGQALALALGKAIATADSDKALDVLRGQIEAVRGVLGNQLADGFLDQANRKAQELKASVEQLRPGVNSVAEAFKTFGLQTQEQLRQLAETSQAAYAVLRDSGQASAEQLRQAFVKAANDAIAANGGIAPEWVKVESAIRDVQVVSGEYGQTSDRVAAQATAATGRMADGWRAVGSAAKQAGIDAQVSAQELAANAKKVQELNDRNRIQSTNETSDGLSKGKDGAATGTFTNALPIDQAYAVQQAIERGQHFTADDIETVKAAYQQAKNAYEDMDAFRKLSPGGASFEYQQSVTALMNAARTALEQATAARVGGAAGGGAVGAERTVNVNFAGLGRVRTDQQGEATINKLVQQLQDAAGRST